MKCLCKKDFSSKLISNMINENELLLFEKNKYYDFEIELSEDPIENRRWVIYDPNGNASHTGIRFHIQKNKKKVVAMYNFFDYFYSERAMKLIKIKEYQNEKM